jgi:hypothetical protein
MAIVVANRCSVVACVETGSSRMAPDTSKAEPAAPSKQRPTAKPGPNVIASPSDAIPTRQIASSTAEATGKPGSASRLIVRAIGS